MVFGNLQLDSPAIFVQLFEFPSLPARRSLLARPHDCARVRPGRGTLGKAGLGTASSELGRDHHSEARLQTAVRRVKSSKAESEGRPGAVRPVHLSLATFVIVVGWPSDDCQALTIFWGRWLTPKTPRSGPPMPGAILLGMSHTLTVEYGDEVLFVTGQSPSEFAAEARFLLAAKLYELGRLSSSRAAQLCGMGRVAFLLALPRVRVTVSNMSADDADDELAFAQHG
jgi:predicted HTH domain antitoxin